MQTENNILIEEMLVLTEESTNAARQFKALTEDQLNFRNHPGEWNVLECIEHLNRYGDFYLPAIEKAMLTGKSRAGVSTYKSGLIGNYFANLMKVKNGKVTRMKTPSDKNPLGSELSITTIDRFLKQQDLLVSLLNQGRHCDLTRTRVPISLTRFIRLGLGDTFRFFVYHIERHIRQAQRVSGIQG